tara:strand:- start:611 stop:799 length:189 start_codon:yes stop_codon:yes gene_type:complete
MKLSYCFYLILIIFTLSTNLVFSQYDNDMDNDGIFDSYDNDMDNDGIFDSYDNDMDNDGIWD